MDASDRGAILEMVYALLRHRARLGWWLARVGPAGGSDPGGSARLRLLVWLAVAERMGADQAGRLMGGLSGAEVAMLARLKGCTMEHPDMPEAVRLECPDWALGPLRQRFGAGLSAEMAATLVPPPLDLRVNPVKSNREAMLADMRAAGLAPAPMRLAPHGIRLAERLSLDRVPGLKTGEVEIQDEGSQLVAALVDARPGDRVVDFCAGAGGKTLALAAQMMNRGHLVACDVNEARLKRCAERMRRAGLHNAEMRVLSSETDRWIKRHKGGFDRVLVDAPCSGTGTWRRNPDARWRAPDLGLEGMVALQGRILASAARLVKPGGRLVYATCSILDEENEAQVAAFLAASPEFRLVPVADAVPGIAGLGGGGHLSLTPAQHQTDGFFAAVLQRVQTS
jgi:16S rRNA (cytosine967-C5)-methyltransferase